MKQERIYITDNPTEEFEVRRDVLRAFEPCKQAVEIVKGFGFAVSFDIVKDCLSLRKVVKQVEVEGTAKWVGERNEHFAKEYAATEVYEGDEHLRTALKAMLHDIESGSERAAAKKAKSDTLVKEYEGMLDSIYALFHVGSGRFAISTKELLRYVIVEDGSVSLPANINERIKADTATYAEAPNGIAAYKLHKEISEKLTALADLMKNASRDNFTSNLHNLFILNESGVISPAPIDYDLYTN